MNYYEVAFKYKHATRGSLVRAPSGGMFHIAYAVNERMESERLWDAMRAVDSYLSKLKLEYRSSYCFPDGSLYRYIKIPYSLLDLEFILSGLGMPFEVYPIDEPEKAQPGSRLSVAEEFRRPSGRALQRMRMRQSWVRAICPDIKTEEPSYAW